MLCKIPIGLIILRFILGPTTIIAYFYDASPYWYTLVLTLGFLSDILDGIIARRLNISTDRLRSLDSWADTAFYSSVFIVALILHKEIISEFWISITTLIALELIRHAFDQIKYRQSTSYHMWSAKVWGIFLYLGFVQLLGFNEAGFFFSLAIYTGILTDIEGILASILLSKWQSDVPSIYHAYKIEKANN